MRRKRFLILHIRPHAPLIFPPTPTLPHFLSRKPLVAPFKNTHVTSVPRIHIHLFSPDQERHLWSLKYFNFLCVCIFISLQFFASFPFPVLFIEYCILFTEKQECNFPKTIFNHTMKYKKQSQSTIHNINIKSKIHTCIEYP